MSGKWRRYPGDKSYLKDHPLMTPPYTCRLCGGEYEPEEEGQLYCNEDCESRDRKIDEAEQRREERG